MTESPNPNDTPAPHAPDEGPAAADEMPPGDHPLEVAARSGIGPLSALGQKVWHGEALPCVSCGQLVRRNTHHCDSCGQDLSDEMIARMRAHAGPWYVLEHLRPFPGVTLERIVLQVRRGLITPVSIVRGPSTDYQWRFAVETPGLCRLFGRCWNCYHGVRESTEYCPGCLSHLGFERPASKPAAVQTQPVQQSRDRDGAVPARVVASQAQTPSAADNQTGVVIPAGELARLASAARLANRTDAARHEPAVTASARGIWIAIAAIIVVVAGLLWFSSVRSNERIDASPNTAQPAPDSTGD